MPIGLRHDARALQLTAACRSKTYGHLPPAPLAAAPRRRVLPPSPRTVELLALREALTDDALGDGARAVARWKLKDQQRRAHEQA